jgi:hypothetical protein
MESENKVSKSQRKSKQEKIKWLSCFFNKRKTSQAKIHKFWRGKRNQYNSEQLITNNEMKKSK